MAVGTSRVLGVWGFQEEIVCIVCPQTVWKRFFGGGGGGGQGRIRREGASEAAPGAVRQAVGGVGGGYCRLQMPSKLALGVQGTVAGC